MDAALTKKANDLAKEFAGQATTLEELNEVMRALMKTALERMLNTELDAHLGRVSATGTQPPDEIIAATNTDSATDAAGGSSKARNRRNGTSPKTIQGDMGRLPLAIPRDRDGTFEPLLLGKYQRRLPGFDEKILALYAKGLTTRDIQDLVKELYGVEISPTLVSEITEDLAEEVQAWQTRRLEAIWPIVFMDGIVVHIRGESGRVTEHTMYVAIGVNFAGKKELLGLWLNETEGFSLGTNHPLRPRGNQSLMMIGLRRGHEKVLAVVPDGSEESWRDRHLHHLRGWAHGISGGHSNGVPPGPRAVVHRASGASRFEVCHGRRQPRGHSRSAQHLSSGHRAGSRTGTEDVWRTLGHEISHDLQTVDGEVAAHHFDVRPARRDPQSDLHDEHD